MTLWKPLIFSFVSHHRNQEKAYSKLEHLNTGIINHRRKIKYGWKIVRTAFIMQ